MIRRQGEKLDALIEHIKATGPRAIPRDGEELPKRTPVGSTNGTRTIICPPKPPLPLIQGPTSPSFGISVVDVRLKERENREGTFPISYLGECGVSSPTFSVVNGQIVDDQPREITESEFGDPYVHHASASNASSGNTVSLSPLEEFDVGEAERLVRTFHVVLGAMFPVIVLDDLLKQLKEIYAVMDLGVILRDASATNALQMDRDDVNILKMTIAIALIAEGGGHCETAFKLYSSLADDVQTKVWSTEIDIKGLNLLILVVSPCVLSRTGSCLTP